jgi:ParB-like chromosome segregation protein Spo0J
VRLEVALVDLNRPSQHGQALVVLAIPAARVGTRPRSRSPDRALVKALARAWRWQRMLDDGIYTTVSDIGDAENISKSYISRILRLALLAPDLVEEILAGQTDHALVLERLERPLPASWDEQRRLVRAGST